MRYIRKVSVPVALQQFLEAQLPARINLDYDAGFTRKPELRLELIAGQYGLCAYTGAPIDERMVGLAADGQNVAFRAHIEHLKPQSVCRRELIANGLEPGVDLGDDMSHENMVAALLVVGTRQEQFGAAARENREFPVWPTHPDCERRFQFGEDGAVRGLDADAVATADVLRLDHETLRIWRRAAIDVFLDPNVVTSLNDLQTLVDQLDRPVNDVLPEFCFCVRSVAQSIISAAP